MKKLLALVLFAVLLLSACGTAPAAAPAAETPAVTEAPAPAETPAPTEEPAPTETPEPTEEPQSASAQIPYRFASKEEAAELMLSNTEYYAGFSQNDLDFKLQKVGATMEEYQAFAREQTLDFTEEEIALIDGIFADMEQTLADNGYTLPLLDEVVLIKTTMEEERGAGGYTHGTQIYMDGMYLGYAAEGYDSIVEYFRYFFWHELFHCLTRSNRDFQSEMYQIIHFTTQEEDFPLPPSVFEYHISNPDVEHHNSWATFRINGEDVDCFTDFVTTKHFEQEGDTFFDFSTTALVPIDGTDVYYTPEEAENFDEVFGLNTGYVIDPEECMADNFAYAMLYGIEGQDGAGYPNPEIIEAILECLSQSR